MTTGPRQPQDYRLPETGMVYDPHKREKRAEFRDVVATSGEYRDAMAWFTQTGRFAKSGKAHHPAVIREGENGFIDSLRRGYHEWGSLTQKQFAAMLRSYREVSPLILNVGPPADIYEAPLQGEHFGEVGERHTAKLVVIRTHQIRANGGGGGYINLLEHPSGCQLVFASGITMTQGQHVQARFRIMSHDVFKGVRQTYIGDFHILNTRKPRRVGNAASDNG